MTARLPLHQRKLAPLSSTELAQIRTSLADLRAAAARKGTTLDRWDLHSEQHAGKFHFDLGCWLYYYNKPGAGRLDSVSARVDCLRRIFEAELPTPNPGYQFFTAFNFGERDFDSMLEQGDGREVVDGVLAYARANPGDAIRTALEWMGWGESDEPGEQPGEEASGAPAP